MKKGSKIAIVGCSNGQPQKNHEKLEKLYSTLSELGLTPVFGTGRGSDELLSRQGNPSDF